MTIADGMERREISGECLPSNVGNAAPATVLPRFLCSRFTLVREWASVENEYIGDGSRQTRSLPAGGTPAPRRSWQLTAHIPPAELAALREFLAARRFLEAFYFYDGSVTSPRWLHDPSGLTTTGRFTVVARGGWSQSMEIARGSADVVLEEVT